MWRKSPLFSSNIQLYRRFVSTATGGSVWGVERGIQSLLGRGTSPSLYRGLSKSSLLSVSSPLLRKSAYLSVGVGTALYATLSKAYCSANAVEDDEPVALVEAPPPLILGSSTSTVWREILEELLKSYMQTLAAVLSTVLSTAGGVALPTWIGKVLDTITKGDSVSPWTLLVGLSIGLTQAGAAWVFYSITTNMVDRISTRLKEKLFMKYLSMDISYFDMHKSSELVSHMFDDVKEIHTAVKHWITTGLPSIVNLIGGFGSLFGINHRLGGMMLLILPSMVGLGTIYSYYLRKLSKRLRRESALATAQAEESLANIRTVRVFVGEEKEQQKYHNQSETVLEASRRMNVAIGALSSMTLGAASGVALIVMGYGGLLVQSGAMSPGDLTTFIMQSTSMQKSLSQLAILMSETMRGLSAVKRVDESLAYTPTIPLSSTTAQQPDIEGDIQFDRVNFAYPTRPTHEVLKDFSLSIPKGQVIAIVGESGAGKSTILGLLERFYDPINGEITIDGVNLRDIDPHWLRSNMAIVSQEPALFDTSIRENICYGVEEDIDEDQVQRAVDLANCTDFLSRFPDGIETRVGERGVQLSAGQKQRIAIARALLKDPKILILDEATSALDTESEYLVKESLDILMEGRTTVLVAHRLSTVRHADSIVVLHQGNIVEQGTHDELVRIKDGYYANLVSKQT